MTEEYVSQQGTAALRADERNRLPNAPFPSTTNTMFRYLIARAQWMVVGGVPLSEVMVWVAAHAWFEGSVDSQGVWGLS